MLIELNREITDGLSKTEQEIIKFINEYEKSFPNCRLWILHLKRTRPPQPCQGPYASAGSTDLTNLDTGSRRRRAMPRFRIWEKLMR